VFEAPDAYRFTPEWSSKDGLRETTDMIVEILAGRRCGRRGRVNGYFSRGIQRWHFFGDKSNGKYNPHSNVLVDMGGFSEEVRGVMQPAVDQYEADLKASRQTKKVRRALSGIYRYNNRQGAYLPDPVLKKLKADLRVSLGVPDLIVRWETKDRPGQLVHAVRYVTKSTFKEYDWYPELANDLARQQVKRVAGKDGIYRYKREGGFRNIRWWGRWDQPPVWGLAQAEREGEDVEGLAQVKSLQEHTCPVCGRSLLPRYYDREKDRLVYWSKAKSAKYLEVVQTEYIAAGYYRVLGRDPPGHFIPSPDLGTSVDVNLAMFDMRFALEDFRESRANGLEDHWLAVANWHGVLRSLGVDVEDWGAWSDVRWDSDWN